MKKCLMLFLAVLTSACATKPDNSTDTAKVETNQKITVTGTRVKKSDMASGTKLSMKRNPNNQNSNFMTVLATMQSLPKPKNISDCVDLLSKLDRKDLKLTIASRNNVVLEGEHGIYEYTFDDDSCPMNTAN